MNNRIMHIGHFEQFDIEVSTSPNHVCMCVCVKVRGVRSNHHVSLKVPSGNIVTERYHWCLERERE